MLVDTHALLWWLHDSPDLSARARNAIVEAEGARFFSPVSVYEIEWKTRFGKLGPYARPISAIARECGFLELPIRADHAAHAARLGSDLRDPWDRLLAAQAILSQMPLLTADAHIGKLGVQTIW
ncbi:MAG: type II toxin-antitoxin system VapC family toxin [Pseudomonadota bacterium]